MIQTQTFDKYAVFGENAVKATPDAVKYAAGFKQADVLPAEWLNWAWHKNSKCITALNTGLTVVEKELNEIIRSGGMIPDGSNAQVIAAIKNVIIKYTGLLANLQTTDKSTIVAAANEILSKVREETQNRQNALTALTQTFTQTINAETQARINSDNVESKARTQGDNAISDQLSSHTGNKSNPHGVTGEQVGLGRLYNISQIGFGVCNTDAGVQAKSAAVENIVLIVGARITLKFKNGIATDNPTLNINNTGAKPITMDSQPVGKGCFDAGGCYEFVYTGDSWECLSAMVRTKNFGENASYIKYRNGLIKQWGVTKNADLNTPIYYPIAFTAIPRLICGQHSCVYSGKAVEHYAAGWTIEKNRFFVLGQYTDSYPNGYVDWIAIGF